MSKNKQYNIEVQLGGFMNKYESMTWEELRELPSEEFYKIPKTDLDQAVTEYYERVLPEESEIFVDDSILLFEEPY